MKKETINIYLIRHGQTTGDIEDRYGGEYNDHLSELGKKQAKQLAEKLSKENIEIIYSSPLIRTQETAKILQSTHTCQLETIENLRERNQYGIMTGMVKAEAKEKYPQLVALLQDTHNTIEGGETYEHFQRRITGAFDELANTTFGTIALVTHGGPIRLIFRDILKMSEIDIADCAYVK